MNTVITAWSAAATQLSPIHGRSAAGSQSRVVNEDPSLPGGRGVSLQELAASAAFMSQPNDLVIVLSGEPEFVIAAWPGDGLFEPFRKAFGLGFADDVGDKRGVVTADVLPGLGAAFAVASPDLPDRE